MTGGSFSIELQVALECARFRGARPDRLRSLLERVDPTRLRDTAARHGVLPLGYSQIARLEPPVSPEIIAPLERAWFANIQGSVQLTQELHRILDAFEAAGIPVIPFKGPALAESAYGDICLRQAGDIDLLVRTSDLWDAASLLESLGFAVEEKLTPRQKKLLVKNDCALHFQRNFQRNSQRNSQHTAGAPVVDLQWRFAPEYVPVRFDYAGWFDIPATASLDGRAILAAPKEDVLLYLLFHGSLHTWHRVVHFADVVKHIESHSDWDWAGLACQARNRGMAKILTTGLQVCSQLLDWPIPQEIRGVLTRRSPDRRVQKTINRLGQSNGEQAGNVPTVVFRLSMVDRGWGVVNYVFKRALLPSASDWRFAAIPDRFYFLYYLVRPLRLAWQATLDRNAGVSVPATTGPSVDNAAESERELRISGVDFAELCREISSHAGRLRFQARGQSMRPFLRDGDLLTLEAVTPAQVCIGDIVLYQAENGRPLVHRVLWKKAIGEEMFFLIRGDASRGECDRVSGARVIAKVTEVRRGSRIFSPNSCWRRLPALAWATTPTPLRRAATHLARLLSA
ncbi:MAG TPA: nucleotidyltransferase family protein [Acidobacteriota bacterium]|nr:nucleotidyltransferase family protein [Acidobacteriota bacterium]